MKEKKVWKFTLVELLFVITIIVVMASLLLPALQKAKQKGQEIACRSNLKQIGLAAACYSYDYNEWCIAVIPGLSGDMWPFVLFNFKYIGTKTVFKCPSESIFNFTSARMNYGLNHRTFGVRPGHPDVASQKLQSISKFRHDSSLIYFADTPPVDYASIGIGFISDGSLVCQKPGIYPINSTACWYPVHARHNKRVNAIIFDGHAEGFSSHELLAHPELYWNPRQFGAVLGIY